MEVEKEAVGAEREVGRAGWEVDDWEWSMEAAADVVEAMAVALRGSGWLWFPS